MNPRTMKWDAAGTIEFNGDTTIDDRKSKFEDLKREIQKRIDRGINRNSALEISSQSYEY
jgi:hypothetical protein